MACNLILYPGDKAPCRYFDQRALLMKAMASMLNAFFAAYYLRIKKNNMLKLS